MDFTIIVANLASNTSSMESQIFILRDDQTLLASATSEEAEDYRVYPNFAKSGFFFFCVNDNTESLQAASRILISIFLIFFKLIYELLMSCRRKGCE